MVNSGTRIVFVLFPGVKDFMKQYSKNNETYAMIRRALKVNILIICSRKKATFFVDIIQFTTKIKLQCC